LYGAVLELRITPAQLRHLTWHAKALASTVPCVLRALIDQALELDARELEESA
jgi:hypothetical protein